MIGLGRAAFAYPVAERSVAPLSAVVAQMTYTGRRRIGSTGETRTITSLNVTNNSAFARTVRIESEATKQSFSATVPAGQTVAVTISPLAQYWNTDVAPMHPRWDGLNIYWS